MIKDIIVIPTYNEKDNIVELLGKIFSLMPNIYVMIVDDNSPDGTADLIEKLKNQYPNLLLFKRGAKEGLGPAYMAAFKKILENPEYSTITMMDGDLSHDPKYLPEMLDLSKQYDLVIGSRYVKGGGVTKKWNIWRRFLSSAGNIYIKILFFKYKINDWSTGYNIIKTSSLKKIDLNVLSLRGYAFISSLKYYLASAGATIKESPIFFEERKQGKTKMSFSIILEGLLAPWKIIIREFSR